LDAGGQEELVAGPVRTAQPQPVEAEDALQVREQDLDLLALPPRGAADIAARDVAGQVRAPSKRERGTLRAGSLGQQRGLRVQTSHANLLAR
jgi:hypothetical protein